MIVRTVIFIAIGFLAFHDDTQACDFPMPDIQVSEFVSDKTIFWGRAISEKWDRNRKIDFRPNTFHEVEVFKTYNGQAKGTVKVWGDKTSCQTYIPLGEVFLFVTKQNAEGDFYTESTLSDIASNQGIVNYFNAGIDTKVGGAFYPPTLENLLSGVSSKWKRECVEGDPKVVNDSDYCLPEKVIAEMSLNYKIEYEEVKAEATKTVWWKSTFK